MTNAFEKLYRGVQFQSSLQPTWAEQQSLEGYYRKEADELAKQRYQLTIENMELREKLREAERLAMLWMARYEHDKITPLGVDRLFKCESELAEAQEQLSKRESELAGVKEKLRGIMEQLSRNTANLSAVQKNLMKKEKSITSLEEEVRQYKALVASWKKQDIFRDSDKLKQALKPLMGCILIEEFTVDCSIHKVGDIPDGALVAYTDGSYMPSNKQGGWGVVMFFNGGVSMEAYMRVVDVSDVQEVELFAAYTAVFVASKVGEKNLYICYDNASVGTDARVPKVAKALGVSVLFKKVAAHSGDALNNRADKLAGTYKTNPLKKNRTISHSKSFVKTATGVTV